MMTTIISPSLLSCDFMNIETELKHFDKAEDIWFHLDIMDGHFVPNMTFGNPIIKMISKLSKHPLDAHFMVTNPEFYIETLKDIPIHNFTFHYEATKQPLQLIKEAKMHFPSVGISLKPGTSFNELSDDLLCEIDLLLVMSVEPGFGGQSFIIDTWDKLEEIRSKKHEKGFDFMVQVDGGVGSANSAKLIESGCNNLVAGSFVFKGGPTQYLDNISLLRG
jgi:ribulose-phosphate 3-epimerase